jgi:hypothetical protein
VPKSGIPSSGGNWSTDGGVMWDAVKYNHNDLTEIQSSTLGLERRRRAAAAEHDTYSSMSLRTFESQFTCGLRYAEIERARQCAHLTGAQIAVKHGSVIVSRFVHVNDRT